MKVPFCLNSDYDHDEYFEPIGCVYLAGVNTFKLGEIFSNFLNGEEGQIIIDFLMTKNEEITLIQIFPRTRGLAYIKIILTSVGIVSRICTTNGEVTEDEVSCLHSCYVGEYANRHVFKEKNLIPWLKKQYKKLRLESKLVSKSSA
jgi:hypothetical protein